MDNDELYVKYETLYLSLKQVISESEKRIVVDEPDLLFIDNVNFFVKSYLINICTYLEAYLQDTAFNHAKKINSRIKSSNIPYNFLYWNISKDVKDKDLKFCNSDFKINKKSISDQISANPYKTIKLFRFLGVDLDSNENFSNLKDLINSVVVKRNNIIHHNDNAIDIALSDLLDNIDVFLEYMRTIRDILNHTENGT